MEALNWMRAERERLRVEIGHLDAAIAALEAKPVRRRGRRSMGEAERLVVSARMKRYWDGYQAQKAFEAQKAVENKQG